MYNLVYTKLAEQDLFDIFDYISQDKPTVAIKYINKLESFIELLQTNPYLGIECQHKNIHKDCRVLIFENYLIFYKIENEDKILIIRILNSKIDYTNSL